MDETAKEPYDPYLNDEYRIISQYKTKIDASVFGVSPSFYRPTPTDVDYATGFIKRYFVRKNTSTSSQTCEVSGEQYQILQSNPFYKSVSITWQITGAAESYTFGNSDTVIGAREFNLREINKGARVIWQLPSSFKNLLEFYKKM